MATYTVTSLADDGAGDALTLREAIDLANANMGADSIVFDAGLGGTVSLTGSALAITDDLMIDGDLDITVDGAGLSGVFDIDGAAVEMAALTVTGGTAMAGGGLAVDAGSTVMLTNMTFRGNEATGDMASQGGGAIWVDGGTLTVAGGSFDDNAATGAAGSGGHILATGEADVTLTDATLLGGMASRAGGAIEVAGGSDVAISNSLLAGNATGAAPGNGGALHVTGAGSVVDVSDSVVSNNAAASEGGGLWNDAGSTMTVSDSVIRDNDAQGAAADNGGGGLFNNGGTLIVSGTVLDGNTASGMAGSGGNLLSTDGAVTIDGGVIANGTASRAGGGIEVIEGSLSADKVAVLGNSTGPAPGNGGGVHVTGAATTAFTNSVFTDNSASAEGGGLWNSATGAMSISDSVIRANTATGDAADNGGGGVFNLGGSLSITDSVLDANTATGMSGSGGNLLTLAGAVEVTDTILSNGTASRAGGGIEIVAGDLTVTDSLFRGNSTGDAPGNGGGIHVTADATTRVMSSEFHDNFASAEGGALWNSATGTMIVTGTTIARNEAAGDDADQGGGGIFNDGGTLSVSGSALDGNDATGTAGSGGGLLTLDGDVTLDDVAFTGGSATRAGGGIEIVTGKLDITDSLFEGNATGASPGNGGGIHVTSDAMTTILSSEFHDNFASAEGGALWNSATGTMTVAGSIISGNIAAGDAADNGGGGIFNLGGALSVEDTTLANNAATGMSGSGGHLLSVDGDVTIDGVDFLDGDASRAGGAIEVIEGDLDVSDSLFDGNVTGGAPGNGGAIHVTGGAFTRVDLSDFFDNFAANEGGALWNSATGTMIATRSLFVGNESPTGGAVFGKGGEVILTGGSAFFDNLSDTGTVDVIGTEGLTLGDAEFGPVQPVLASDAGERLIFGRGDQIVDGRGGDDLISGGAGDDLLFGGDGDDILTGASGANSLTGGAGADTFAFVSGATDGMTVITDFGAGDKIALDDRFFGLGNGRVDPRQVTGAEAQQALADGLIGYSRSSGELTLDLDGIGGEDGFVIARIEGDTRLGLDDVLLF